MLPDLRKEPSMELSLINICIHKIWLYLINKTFNKIFLMDVLKLEFVQATLSDQKGIQAAWNVFIWSYKIMS